MGKGEGGRLGHGDEEDWDEPEMIEKLIDVNVKSIHATSSTSFAVGKQWDEGDPIELFLKPIANVENVSDS